MTYDEARAEAERLLDGREHEWAWFVEIVPVLIAQVDLLEDEIEMRIRG